MEQPAFEQAIPFETDADIEWRSKTNGTMRLVGGSDGSSPNLSRLHLRSTGAALFFGKEHSANIPWHIKGHTQDAGRAEASGVVTAVQRINEELGLLADNAAAVTNAQSIIATLSIRGITQDADL